MLLYFRIKPQKSPSIRSCKILELQKNLQLCYSAILDVRWHCSTIVNQNIIFYSGFPFSFSLFFQLLSLLQKKCFGAAFLKLCLQKTQLQSDVCVKCSSTTGHIATFTKHSYKPALKLRFMILRLRLARPMAENFSSTCSLNISSLSFSHTDHHFLFLSLPCLCR